LFIKICGLNSIEAIESSISNGADAIGFVFAESPRKVSPEKALSLCKNLPKKLIKVAVTKNPSKKLFKEIINIFKPDWIQGEANDLLSSKILNKSSILPVFRDSQPIIHTYPSRILYEGENSGKSEIANWGKAAKISERTQLILAGGLNLTNIEKAIKIVSPWGVDISSGVESKLGIKDPKKISAFISLVRSMEKS
tara:strand:- start:123302 stop:123889 length:588 start_codon:yes stop_codon:yes gene_type:complete